MMHRKPQALSRHTGFPVPVIGCNIRLFLQTAGHGPLHERRGVDKARHPGGDARRSIEQVIVCGLAGDHQIADALPGQGQGLGPAVADDGIGIVFGEIGNLYPVIGQLPVGFIGDQINVRTVFMLLLP